MIRGSKGGESTPSQPYIAPDTLRSVDKAKLLYALSEGEVEGFANGLASIKLNDTPLYDEEGNENFPGVRVEFRSGTINQPYIPGFPETNNEISVGVEIKSEVPWIRAFTNPDLSAVRVRVAWNRLLQQKSNGDTVGYRVDYAIDVSTDGGAYQENLFSVDGKSESAYKRSHRIDLPAGNNWLIRVRRITPNANNLQVADKMEIEAITEVIDAKLRYPHTSLLAIEYDSEQFKGSIAKLSVNLQGRRIQVPANYDPVTRTYVTTGEGTTAGVWDGTFKEAYSNNPAWIWMDIVQHKRYGIGRRISAAMVNKWKLYQIAQYCDVMVPDGKGGMEPRYTCNLYLQSRKEAYVLLGEIASIFHGASFWDGSQMIVNADMPADPVYTYTRANIIDGAIEYKGSAGKDRHSLYMVKWDDPSQGYDSMYEPVTGDMTLLDFRQADIGAIGCTSQGQAQRAGKWAILSEQLETRVPTFRVGLDGQIPRPGDIINLADELLQGRANGGRIQAVGKKFVTSSEQYVTSLGRFVTAGEGDKGTVALDRVIDAKVGDRLIVNLPSGKSESREIKTIVIADGLTMITLAASFSEEPVAESVWAIDSDELSAMQFRVTRIARPEFHQFEISGVLHVPGKFQSIDSGVKIEAPPITMIPPGVQAPPKNVVISQGVMIEQTLAVTTMTISWESVANAVAYDVEWRKDSGEWVKLPRTGGLNIDVQGVYTGQYLARVRAVNSIGIQSVPASSILTEIVGKAGKPSGIAYLRADSKIMGIDLHWGFPQGVEDTLHTEIQYASSMDEANLIGTMSFAYPVDTYPMTGLSSGVRFYFRARLVDRTGNVGDWSEFVSGESSSDPGVLLEYLSGKITETQLAQSLIEKIEGDDAALVEVDAVKDALAAMYTIKTQLTVDNVPYLAGIGVGVENDQGNVTSQILLSAQRVAVLNEVNGVTKSPFVIENGTTYIDSAFIGDATITNAKIANASITNAKIANTSITNAKIANATITGAKIKDLSVDTLQIAGHAITQTISNYVPAGLNLSSANSEYEIAKASIDAAEGSVLVWFSVDSVSSNYFMGGTTAIVYVRIYRDNVLLREVGFAENQYNSDRSGEGGEVFYSWISHNFSSLAAIVDTPTPGAHVYRVTAHKATRHNQAACSIGARTLTILATKR